MLITKQFVFLHVPKTGGSFVQKLCQERLPPGSVIKQVPHGSHDVIPSEFAHLPRLCFVRNPWDWYVSWYHHGVRAAAEQRPFGRSLVWRVLFDEGRNDFRATVAAASGGRQLVAPAGRGPRWLQAMNELDLDHYTATHRVMVGTGSEADRVEVGRFENLREDFLDFLRRHDVPVGSEFEHAVLASPPENPGERGDYREYYDDELRELVGRRAHIMIEEFGYSFENGA